MQRSFSIVDDDDTAENFDDEQILRKYSASLNPRKKSPNVHDFEQSLTKMASRQPLSHDQDSDISKILSAGPSGRQTMLRSHPPTKIGLSSDSELDDSDLDEDKTKNKNVIPGEYDPKLYEDLDVSQEIKEVFQYITKYIPQPMTLDNKFKPFVPDFLPAVGDIDAFLKVTPPSTTLSGDEFLTNQELGLTVLDEPAADQSDAALLHLQLRAESVKSHDSDVVVKKIDNVEKNVKIIDKWIKDITALHKSKSFPAVRYTEPMPDLDELMEEWPEDVEKKLKEQDFPEPRGTLSEYIEEVCGLFQIPVKNKMQGLHLLFSLYAAVKSSQLFKNSQIEKAESLTNVADQLLLE